VAIINREHLESWQKIFQLPDSDEIYSMRRVAASVALGLEGAFPFRKVE
jgi:hypothetical protein